MPLLTLEANRNALNRWRLRPVHSLAAHHKVTIRMNDKGAAGDPCRQTENQRHRIGNLPILAATRAFNYRTIRQLDAEALAVLQGE